MVEIHINITHHKGRLHNKNLQNKYITVSRGNITNIFAIDRTKPAFLENMPLNTNPVPCWTYVAFLDVPLMRKTKPGTKVNFHKHLETYICY